MYKFRHGSNPDHLIHYGKALLTIIPLEWLVATHNFWQKYWGRKTSKIKWLFESISRYYNYFKCFTGLGFSALQPRPLQTNFLVMYVHVLLFQNICLLTYFQIKIPACVDEAENILHVFYKHCFFWVSISMLMVFLNSVLHYACNTLEIVEST